MEEPSLNGYQPHPSDVSSLEDARELPLADFAKIATGLEGYIFQLTLKPERHYHPRCRLQPGRDDASCSNLPHCHVYYRKPPHFQRTGNRRDYHVKSSQHSQHGWGIDETSTQKELQNPTTEFNIAPIIAPTVTRKRKQKMLQSDHSPTLQESRPPAPTAPPKEMPPLIAAKLTS